MYQTDWILRQIEQMGDVLRRLFSALREDRPAEALALSFEGVEELLDADPGMIDALSGEGLVTLLAAGGELDVFRAHMLAEVLLARAEALTRLGRQDEAGRELLRAVALLEAARPLARDAEAARIVELLGWARSAP